MSDALGFVGLGVMGAPIAKRLLAAGLKLVVYDNRAEAAAPLVEAGAALAPSLAELGAAADIVFLSLPTPEVVRAVCLGEGGLASAERARIIVDLSTTGPKVETEVAEALAAHRKTLVDCPVSGGVRGAEAGTLALMAAGEPEAVAAVAPFLEKFGKVLVVGEKPGLGQTMKVLNNLVSTAALTITSEAMVLGAKAGLDPDRMLEVLNAGSGRTNASTTKLPQNVLTRKFDFGFPIALSCKDARLCLEEADRLGSPMLVGTAVRQMLNLTRDTLGPDADLTSVIRVVEGWAGVEVKGAAAD